MLIDDIDFADLYRKQLQLANRTEKKPEHWDKRAEKMAENCASLTDSYLLQLLGKIDLKGRSRCLTWVAVPVPSRWRWLKRCQ